MASLRKRIYSSGNYAWVIEYRIGKKLKMKTLGPVDKRTAEQLFYKFCAELAKNRAGIIENKTINLKRYIEVYFEYAEVEKASSTLEREKLILGYLINYFGDVNLEDIDIIELKNYRLYRLDRVSKVTVNIEFRTLKAIFNVAKKLNYLHENPFTAIKPLRIPESDLESFFELEAIQIVREAFRGDDFEYIVEFYLLTGVRRNEALYLTWDDVDLKRKKIVIRSEHTKGKKHRIIQFEDDVALEQLLKNLPKRSDNLLFGPIDGRPQWKPRWVSKKISKKLSKIGFPWASCHTFRHTFISHLVMAGVPLTTVQQLVGHRSFTTTLKYAHLAPKHKNEMITKRPY